MKRGLIQILLANIIYLIINIISSFLLPKLLSIDTYAVLKTYTFYVGYAGFLSLGYADGMYLKYGGEDINHIDFSDLSSNYKSYILLEISISFICLVISLVIKDFVFMAFAVSSFCINLIGYYKNFYQAVGEFQLYGKALNYQSILLFAVNMLLLFLLRTDDSKIYIITQVGTAAVVMFYLTFRLERKTAFMKKGKASLDQIKENILSGFTLMLGNFSSSIFTGLDRWFVKILMTSIEFAYYSFAVSLENIINVFISPITISLYNVFCKNKEIAYIYKIKKLTLLWGFLVITAAFPVKFIIKYYLIEYSNAIDIIFLLFAAQAFYVIIKGVHVNLYKVKGQQKKYFLLMIVMIVIAITLNIIVYFFLKNTEAFAIGTFLTAVIWFIYCEVEDRKINFHKKEYIAIILFLIAYFTCSMIDNSVFGFVLYMLSYCTIALVFMFDSLIYVLQTIKIEINKIRIGK